MINYFYTPFQEIKSNHKILTHEIFLPFSLFDPL